LKTAGENGSLKFTTALHDVRDRVRSMALVHEKLYQSKSLASVDFAEYTRELLQYLFRSYGKKVAGIRVTHDLESVPLPVDAAVPCGLILNELASNAIHHAFTGRTGGTITASLHALPDGKVSVGISDNGRGLPRNVDWDTLNSLGLRLVRMLTHQLHGELSMTSGEWGTKIALVFTVPQPYRYHEDVHAS